MNSGCSSTGVPSPPKATLRDWLGLGVITLPCLLYAMDVTVLNVAVPRISLELQPTSTQLLWIVDIYTFLLAALLITMGALGDRIGRRRLLLIGAAGFGIASLIAAFSNSTTMLTVGHLIGSMLTPAFVRRVSAMAAIAYGLLVGAVGLVMIAAMEQVSRVEILAGGLFILSVGLAPVYISAINLMVGTVPPERAGEAASISETGSEFGAAMGVAIMGSIANFAYRLALESAIPIGVPPDSAQAALQTLAGAIAIAQQLPAHLGVPLLEGARAAFEESLRVVAALCAGAVVAIAARLLVLTRSRPSVQDRADQRAI